MFEHGDPIFRRTRLSDLANGFRQAAVILTAVDLGVFKALSAAPASLESLTQNLTLSRWGLEKLLLALVALDLVASEGDLFMLHGDAEEFLREGAPGYQGDILRHNFHLLKRWAHLDEAVRQGTSPFQGEGKAERTPDELRAFIMGMENISRYSAEEVADGLMLEQTKSILDLGGGPGTYLYAFLTRLPTARGTILDLPPVIEIAREQTKIQNMTERVSYLAGDMHTIDLGGPYDLIFLGNIIHSQGAIANRQLCQRCAEALATGGQLVIKDFFLDETGTRPLSAALFSLNMLVGTVDGTSFRWADARQWLAEAGLAEVQSFRVAQHSGVLVGRKG